MNDNVLVSIVVPIFNQEKYLDISIPTLINQSYSNLEIILVNDGSTDSSLKIIEKYKKIDARIVLVDKPNGGLVDASIVGVKKSKGDYIAFLDPDDYFGTRFIDNFIEELDADYDFIASGFYRDNRGSLTPYLLSANQIYDENDIKELKRHFLIGKNTADIPHDIFVSRWNKIYKRECVIKVIETFEKCKGISLGEDSIFTYLILSNSKLCKTIQAANTYYYNVGNQNSMMKNESINKHLQSAKMAFDNFSELLIKNNDTNEQAYALYYHLVNSLLDRVQNSRSKEFNRLYKKIKKDQIYQKALKICIKRTINPRKKVLYIVRKFCPNTFIFKFLTEYLKQFLKKIVFIYKDVVFFFLNIKKNGIIKTSRLLKFRNDRRKAFKDLYKKISMLQERIDPFLKKFDGEATKLAKCPICRKIFVFWWDGFETAPEVVKQCLESVKKFHQNSEIIEITKDTYKKYTDINPIILADYEKGKISVQTFSDILRFNLLKNNGGTWIDATIFFLDKYDLNESLQNKPIESVEFATSKDFFEYKEEHCSWSGYFISSRKNSVFVTAVDYVFEQYYLKYRTYSTYFFIDAVLMICKLNKLDNDALNNISYNSGDMFVLGKILYEQFSPLYLETIKRIPQKLQWGYNVSNDESTNYNKILMKVL